MDDQGFRIPHYIIHSITRTGCLTLFKGVEYDS